MPTTKLNLPLITDNMTANVVRDMNALAEAIDGKVGEANGLAVLGPDGKLPADQLNVDTSSLATKAELVEHQNDDTKHLQVGERDTWNAKQNALPAENRRKITFGTEEPTGGVDGDIYFQYE